MYKPDVGVIDLLVGLPGPGFDYWSDKIRQGLMDEDPYYEKHLAHHLYTSGMPEGVHSPDYLPELIATMDEHGVERGVVSFAYEDRDEHAMVERHPERFVPALNVDPNDGMRSLREMEAGVKNLGIKAVAILPVAYHPQVPINDKKLYPIYAKCIELDIAAMVSIGVPGPRVPLAPQKVELVDEVAWFFPELRMILRHGGDPWIDMVVKLLHKYPNLYYATSGWAPKYYPEAIVRFANSRGADKVMFAGYVPYGLTYERIFTEMADVSFRPEVFTRFFRENAVAALKLEL